MKTSNIEVQDMLSVFSVEEVEDRIGKVPGVESVTVNYAAKSATVRYDETQLEVGDIKSGVRQSGYESGASDNASAGKGYEGHTAPVAPIASPAAPKTDPITPATAGAIQDKAASTPPVATVPKPSSATPDALNTGDEKENKAMPKKS